MERGHGSTGCWVLPSAHPFICPLGIDWGRIMQQILSQKLVTRAQIVRNTIFPRQPRFTQWSEHYFSCCKDTSVCFLGQDCVAYITKNFRVWLWQASPCIFLVYLSVVGVEDGFLGFTCCRDEKLKESWGWQRKKCSFCSQWMSARTAQMDSLITAGTYLCQFPSEEQGTIKEQMHLDLCSSRGMWVIL